MNSDSQIMREKAGMCAEPAVIKLHQWSHFETLILKSKQCKITHQSNFGYTFIIEPRPVAFIKLAWDSNTDNSFGNEGERHNWVQASIHVLAALCKVTASKDDMWCRSFSLERNMGMESSSRNTASASPKSSLGPSCALIVAISYRNWLWLINVDQNIAAG